MQGTIYFMDDTVLIRKDGSENFSNFRDVSDRLQQSGLKLNQKECKVLQSNFKYLEHIMDKDGFKSNITAWLWDRSEKPFLFES